MHPPLNKHTDSNCTFISPNASSIMLATQRVVAPTPAMNEKYHFLGRTGPATTHLFSNKPTSPLTKLNSYTATKKLSLPPKAKSPETQSSCLYSRKANQCHCASRTKRLFLHLDRLQHFGSTSSEMRSAYDYTRSCKYPSCTQESTHINHDKSSTMLATQRHTCTHS